MPHKTKTQRIEGGPQLTRALTFKRDAVLDVDERRVKLSFSSEAPYLRQSWWDDPWVEILSHDEKAVEMERLNTGAPLLYNHSSYGRENHIGTIEKAWLEGDRGYAEVRFSKRSEIDGIWADVRDGILNSVSVGYRIKERQLQKEHESEPDEYLVTKWEPFEVSMVPLAADPHVGVGRGVEQVVTRTAENQKEFYRVTDIGDPQPAAGDDAMTPEEKAAADAKRQADIDATKAREATERKAEIAAATKAALEADQTRRAEVRGVFTPYAEHDGMRAVMDAAVDNLDVSVDQARKLLLDQLGKGLTASKGANIETGESQFEQFRKGAFESICIRQGLGEDNMSNTFRGNSLVELARRSLEMHGVATKSLSKMDLVGRAITHSSGDFTIILQNVAQKSMLRGWSEAPETFSSWTNKGVLTDFKPTNRIDLNLYPSLPEVPEGSEYTYATIGERGETIQLATHGSIFSITRQAIINDDASMFSRIPQRQGRAAARTVGNLVYAVLIDNPLMSDGIALFHASHGNLAGAGGAPTTATLDAMRTAMATQTDPDDIAAALNITPGNILVPAALFGAMSTVLESQFEVTTSNRNNTTPNSVRNMASVISEARLDANSPTAWYGVAGTMFDGIEVAYLDGVESPYLEQKGGWNVDGVEMKVRIDAGVKALDFRSFYKNDGA